MDKDVAKRLLRDGGVPVVDYFCARAGQPTAEIAARVERELGFPCFVKPANLGSSVGVSKVRTPAALEPALIDGFRYDRKLLLERAVDAREIECAVLGNDQPRASVAGEIVPRHDFYSYQAKYLDENGAELIIPARLTAAEAAQVEELSLAAFRLLELAGMARVDFLLDRKSGALFLNEVNTIPGFTQISMYPKLWEASGLAYPALVSRLIELAIERHQARQALSTRYLP
jgi:D-alanine-D-alanine ligase